MSNKEFEAAVERTLSGMNALSEAQQVRLLQLIEETRKRHARVRQAHQLAMEAIDDWRLHMKYRLFDLEARQRELEAERKDLDAERSDGADDLDS